MLSNAWYNRLKFVALVGLPAVAAFYLTLGDLWGFPEPQKVSATIVGFATLLGILLQVSTAQYNKNQVVHGVVNVNETDDKKTFDLEMAEEPDDLEFMKEARFRINKPRRPLA